jgi:hypothetical protein
MDKKSKTPLSILLSGYIFSLGFYFIWCFYFFSGRLYSYDHLLVIGAVVFAITAVYLFPLLLILYVKSFQKVWTSFSLVSIITLLIFFLIPPANSLIYYMSYDNKLNLKRDKTIKTIEKNGPERKTLVANNIKINKQFEDAKEKIQTEQIRMEEIESKLNNSLATNDVANTSIAELQEKLESERKENDKLRKKLNETIRKLRSKDEINLALRSKLKEELKAEEDIIVKGKSNRDSSEIKINSKVDNTDLDSIGQEIIFKVQIISSDTILSINSPKLKGLKNVWEYKDGGLYKYTVGNAKDLKSASVLQSEFRRKGFVGAFVVAFKNGKRIPVREARKLLN